MKLLATASTPGGPACSTLELLQRARSERPLAQVLARTGIHARHLAPPETTCASLGATALRAALQRAGLAPPALRRLIFTCSTGGDALIPATANAVLREIGASDRCDGFDLNNACTGFLTAFDLAARSVATGLAPVAVVSVELLSRFVTPADPRPYLVLGDAAAAAVFGSAAQGGVLAATLGNHGTDRNVRLGHPGLSGQPEFIRFLDSSRDMTAHALALIRRCADEVLGRAELTMADVHWVVPHQPNGVMLDAILQTLGVTPEQTAPIVSTWGSLGSASMAVGLDQLLRTRHVRPGQRVLLIGIGAGLSYGALLYQVAP